MNARLYAVVFEERADAAGNYYHLVTLWRSTTAERKKYEEASSRRPSAEQIARAAERGEDVTRYFAGKGA